MSPDGTILWERRDKIGIAVIDRPARRNALSAELCDELRRHLVEHRDLRAVVIGGSGDKAFCAGADLARRAEDTGGLTHGGGDTFRPAFEALLDEIVGYPAPVIAAVNGHALGAGMQLAVACDLRVVAPSATFGIPAGRLGVAISAINAQRLAQTVGQPMARDILFTARSLNATEAASVGLVQRAVRDALNAAIELAIEVASLAPISARVHKAMLTRVATSSGLPDDDRAELHGLEVEAFQSDDLQEGLAAFSEKRSANFLGR
ncbi:MAG: enoyl-CoA hydratase/isomerase family protein [Actinomycetota bacterium]